MSSDYRSEIARYGDALKRTIVELDHNTALARADAQFIRELAATPAWMPEDFDFIRQTVPRIERIIAMSETIGTITATVEETVQCLISPVRDH